MSAPRKTSDRIIIDKVALKRDVGKNSAALKAYDSYKKAADIIGRAEIASGKRVVLKSEVASTLNFEVNRYGACSTTAQEI